MFGAFEEDGNWLVEVICHFGRPSISPLNLGASWKRTAAGQFNNSDSSTGEQRRSEPMVVSSRSDFFEWF
jgi:hypothetical protein